MERHTRTPRASAARCHNAELMPVAAARRQRVRRTEDSAASRFSCVKRQRPVCQGRVDRWAQGRSNPPGQFNCPSEWPRCLANRTHREWVVGAAVLTTPFRYGNRLVGACGLAMLARSRHARCPRRPPPSRRVCERQTAGAFVLDAVPSLRRHRPGALAQSPQRRSSAARSAQAAPRLQLRCEARRLLRSFVPRRHEESHGRPA
jgi:hypothetical protein